MPKSKKNSVLPFTINDRWYAIPVDQIEGVAPVGQSTAIPGNRSRTIAGFGYIMGQLMLMIDCGPLMNLGVSRNARQAVTFRYNEAYYALIVGQVGQLIANPKVVSYKRPLLSCTHEYVDYKKKKITFIDIEQLIEEHICK